MCIVGKKIVKQITLCAILIVHTIWCMFVCEQISCQMNFERTFVIQKIKSEVTIIDDDSIHILVKQHENNYFKLF